MRRASVVSWFASLPILLGACAFQPPGVDGSGQTPDAAVPDAAVPDAAPVLPACASNPVYVAHPTTGVRYRSVEQTTTWSEARAGCMADEADLAIIDDQAENDYVFSLLQQTLWIGLVRVGPGKEFEWVDGRPLTADDYDNWVPPEPNNAGGVEDRAEITAGSTRWSDVADSDANPGYVCECFIPGAM